LTKNDPGPEFWSAIKPYTGNVSEFQRTSRGYSSDLTAIVECETGPFFVKAMRNKPGGRRDQIERERLINPYVISVAPALRWYVDEGAWYVLGFEVVDGRCSLFNPGSPDEKEIVRSLSEIADIRCPELAYAWPETRWNRFVASDEEARLIAGRSLLHSDINPSNFLIGASGTWVVDWAWPTMGAAFIDPACLVVQLVASGHSAESAESWASRCRSWTDADPQAIDAFAAATVRMHRSFVQRNPDAAWLQAMADAAQAWASYRGVPA